MYIYFAFTIKLCIILKISVLMFISNLSNYQLIMLNVFSVISIIAMILIKTAVLVEQEFFEQDLALSYSFDGDTVSTMTLWLVNFFVMFFTFVTILCFNPNNKTIEIIDKIIMCCFFLFNSVMLVDLVTEYLKRGAGEPRPSAFYLCNYKGYADAVDSGNYTSYYESTTFGSTGDFSKCDDIDGFMSWPSGHASTSFASMLASSILLHYNFKFQEPILNTIYYTLLIISTVISVSRVQDNKHHTFDVFSGAIIGCIITLGMWSITHSMLKKLDNCTTEKKHEPLLTVANDSYREF